MKSAWKSKTMWFNWLLSSLVAAVGVVTLYLPETGLSESNLAWAMMGLTLFSTFGNKYLRGITSEGLK